MGQAKGMDIGKANCAFLGVKGGWAIAQLHSSRAQGMSLGLEEAKCTIYAGLGT